MNDIHIGEKSGDNAVLLLAAAENLDLDPSVVRTTSNGFSVPEDVAKEAGFDADGNRVSDAPKAKKTAAKKAPAKKTAARKSPAKKAAAKKTAAKTAPEKPKGEE